MLIEARLNEFRLPQLKPASKDSDEKANKSIFSKMIIFVTKKNEKRKKILAIISALGLSTLLHGKNQKNIEEQFCGEVRSGDG